MQRALFILALVLFAANAEAARHAKPKASPAPAQDTSPEGQLALAELAYDEYDYSAAVAQLSAILDKRPANAKTRQRARLLLGFSHYFRKDETSAKATLLDLFRENVDYPFDRDLFHPDLVRFFDTTRNDYVASLNVKPKELVVAPIETPAKPGPDVVSTPPPAQTLGDRNPWIRIFPIVGHFANYDMVGGGIFLSLEIALIGMNVGGAVAYKLLELPLGADGQRNFMPGAFEAQVIQNVGGIAAMALAVICIVDAFAWSPARGREAFAKKLQPVVDLGPLGSYRLVFGSR